MGIAPWTLPKKPESRGVVGVAGAKEPKLLLKGKDPRLLPEIDSLLASRGAEDSCAGVCGDGAPKRLPAAVECLVLLSLFSD